jgi:hypothetical protein
LFIASYLIHQIQNGGVVYGAVTDGVDWIFLKADMSEEGEIQFLEGTTSFNTTTAAGVRSVCRILAGIAAELLPPGS